VANEPQEELRSRRGGLAGRWDLKKKSKQPWFMVVYLAAFLCLAMATVFMQWDAASFSPDTSRPEHITTTESSKAWETEQEAGESGAERAMKVLAIAAGVIGASIATIVTLTSRIEKHEAKFSAIPHYGVRPLLGGAVGLVLYAAIRAGLFPAGSSVDAFSPYAVIAFSSIAGYAQERVLRLLTRVILKDDSSQ